MSDQSKPMADHLACVTKLLEGTSPEIINHQSGVREMIFACLDMTNLIVIVDLDLVFMVLEV